MEVECFKHRMVLSASTSLLIILTVFGSALPGISLGGYNVFLFIIYLGVHLSIILSIMMISEEYTLNMPMPVLLLILFLLYMTLSYFWTVNPRDGFIRLVIVLSLASITCVMYWSSTTGLIANRYIKILELTALLGIIIAAIEITTGTHLPVSMRYGEDEIFKATAWHVNENDFSNYLAVVSFFFLSRLFYQNDFIKRVGGLAIFVSSFLIIYQNDSLAALLAIICGIILMVGLYIGRQRLNVITAGDRNVPLFTVFAAIGLLGTIIVFIMFTVIPNPFNKWSSLWYRWQLYAGSIEMLFRTVGRGVGVGGFRTSMAALPILPDRAVPAHSWLANILSELGILGILLFLFAYARTLDRLLWKFLQNGERVALGLLVSMTVFLISGIGPSVPLMLQVHWIVWGIALGYIYTK